MTSRCPLSSALIKAVAPHCNQSIVIQGYKQRIGQGGIEIIIN